MPAQTNNINPNKLNILVKRLKEYKYNNQETKKITNTRAVNKKFETNL